MTEAEIESMRYVCVWCGAHCLNSIDVQTHYCPDDPRQKEIERLRANNLVQRETIDAIYAAFGITEHQSVEMLVDQIRSVMAEVERLRAKVTALQSFSNTGGQLVWK